MNELAVNWKWAIQGYLTRGLPISVSLSLFLVTCFLLSSVLSLSLDSVFSIFFIPLVLLNRRSCALRYTLLVSSSHFLSLSFCQSSLVPVSLHNVDLNDIFGRKFRSNREKHFSLSGFLLWVLLPLFARTRVALPFFIGFFVNNCDARRT